jgi:hypothetical protein
MQEVAQAAISRSEERCQRPWSKGCAAPGLPRNWAGFRLSWPVQAVA